MAVICWLLMTSLFISASVRLLALGTGLGAGRKAGNCVPLVGGPSCNLGGKVSLARVPIGEQTFSGSLGRCRGSGRCSVKELGVEGADPGGSLIDGVAGLSSAVVLAFVRKIPCANGEAGMGGGNRRFGKSQGTLALVGDGHIVLLKARAACRLIDALRVDSGAC